MNQTPQPTLFDTTPPSASNNWGNPRQEFIDAAFQKASDEFKSAFIGFAKEWVSQQSETFLFEELIAAYQATDNPKPPIKDDAPQHQWKCTGGIAQRLQADKVMVKDGWRIGKGNGCGKPLYRRF